MNGSDNNVDVGLTLGYSNNTVNTRLNNSPGAGVNAGSSVDITFAASDPLSELVWSPHKGLFLRCADCSNADKKPLLLWNVGPSNMIPPPSQSIRYEEIDDNKIVDGNLVLSRGGVHFDSELAQRASFAQSPGSSTRQIIGSSTGPNTESCGKKVERNSKERAPLGDDEDKEVCSHQIEHTADMANGSQKKTGSSDSKSDMAISKPTSGKLQKEMPSGYNDVARAPAFGSHIVAGVTTASELQTEIESGACIPPLLKSQCQDGSIKEVALATEEERKSKIKTNGSKSPPFVNLESTAENDLVIKKAYWQSEDRLLRGSSVPLEISRVNNNQKKGKNKAFSDGNFSGRSSNDEDDSNESVESCNSAGLLSRGKKRLRYVESLIVDSKRMKKQIDESRPSTSMVRNSSSFMNWISNMVKGFSKSSQEEAPCHALTLAHSNDRCASILQETIVCHEPSHSDRNMGFQTIFQSLYSQSTKLSEARVRRDDCSIEEAQELVRPDKTTIGNFQISCSGQDDMSSDRNFMSNDKSISSIADIVGQSSQPCLFTTSIPVQGECEADLGENRASSNPKGSEYRGGGICSFGSLGKQKTTTEENDAPVLASKGGAINDISDSNKGNMFSSLWITRFSPKAAITSLSLVHSTGISCEAFEYPAVGTTFNPQGPEFAAQQKRSEDKDFMGEKARGLLGKELRVFATGTEPSVASKEVPAYNHQNAGLKLNPVLPSEKFKCSEAMASIFSRRLDALKHIIPSGSESGATCMEATCFFCGKPGHNLQDFLEGSENELECLLSNISSYDGTDDCLRTCIRCFQRDRWAVTRPIGSSNWEQHSEICHLKLCPSNERNSCSLEREDHPKDLVCSRGKICAASDLKKPTTDAEYLGKRSSSSVETEKHLISNSRGNRLADYPNPPACNVFSTQVIEVPTGIFDAVRRLQVSRADILKLMNSHLFVSHLEGFFLRLRLVKWEAGSSESGYHVASITEQTGKSVKDSKKSISVNVGGINCLVGSQYVSNDTFLEDELISWWCRTSRSGGKLPSKDDLESKFEQRIKFGF